MSYSKAKRRNINALPVIFVRDKRGKEVTAILPTLPANAGMHACYAHTGQHGECGEDWMRERTRPAKLREYAPLLAELRGIYESDPDPFELVVCRRITRAMMDERHENSQP